jgi:hypothetical protein
MLAIAFTGLVATIVADMIIPPSPEDRLIALRGVLTELRAAADSCRSALEREEEKLQAEDQRLDSLRTLIDQYETLDPRGVPADSYDTYLTIFNAYNSGIPLRTATAETLQAHWRECRGIAEQHNLTADSARAMATELGFVRDSTSP